MRTAAMPDTLVDALPARIGAIVRANAAATPAAPALREAGQVLSYAQLAALIEQHSQLLRELDVRGGDRVMVVAENCIDQVALIFAITDIDAWVVNVNARLSGAEIDNIVQHSGARRVLYLAAISPDAKAHAERAGAAARGALYVSALNDTCMAEPVAPDNSQVAALIYTTGTTGHPKGVMLTHRNLLFIATVSSTLRGLTPGDRAYGVLPISHVYGLASVMLGTLCAGACLVLAPRFSAKAMLAAIADDGLTILQGVPAMYARMLELAGGPLPSRLRFLYAGGSPLDPVLKQQVESVFGMPLHNGYGMTESSPTISQTRLDSPRADTSVGTVIPGVAIRIVDAGGVDVAAGEAGELWVRGPNVMKGYYREPALTAAAMREGDDGRQWLNTGDMARQDPDGALFIVGRTKELIIRSGFNVYPLEVETVLNAHPGVAQSAVVGRPAAGGNEEVVAFVEAAPAHAASIEELRSYLATRLSPYKCPSRIVIMAALPAAATGKILKGRLKALASELEDAP